MAEPRLDYPRFPFADENLDCDYSISSTRSSQIDPGGGDSWSGVPVQAGPEACGAVPWFLDAPRGVHVPCLAGLSRSLGPNI